MNTEALEKYIIRQYESAEIDFKICKELTFAKIKSAWMFIPQTRSVAFFVFLSFICLSAYIITPLIYETINFPLTSSEEIIGVIVKIIFGLMIIFISSVLSIFFLVMIPCSIILDELHIKLPNREQRELEILTYFQVQKELYDKENFVYNPNQEIITDWKTMTNFDFCQKYFNIQSKNFVRYFKERAELGEIVQENFIIFATNLPKLELLPLDSLRKILINPPLTEAVSKEKLNIIFEDYTPLQIERIFTNHLGKENFHKINKLQQKAKIYANFHSLLENEVINVKYLPKEFDLINGKIFHDLQVKVLKTERDYREASSIFSNCVKSYTDKNGYILTFSMKEEPVACVHVNEQEIKQISGYNNRKCSSENIIRTILKQNNIIGY